MAALQSSIRRTLQSLDLEEHGAGAVTAAGIDHPLFFHPGIISPKSESCHGRINVMPGPCTKAGRHRPRLVDNELLAYLQSIAVSSHRF